MELDAHQKRDFYAHFTNSYLLYNNSPYYVQGDAGRGDNDSVILSSILENEEKVVPMGQLELWNIRPQYFDVIGKDTSFVSSLFLGRFPRQTAHRGINSGNISMTTMGFNSKNECLSLQVTQNRLSDLLKAYWMFSQKKAPPAKDRLQELIRMKGSSLSKQYFPKGYAENLSEIPSVTLASQFSGVMSEAGYVAICYRELPVAYWDGGNRVFLAKNDFKEAVEELDIGAVA